MKNLTKTAITMALAFTASFGTINTAVANDEIREATSSKVYLAAGSNTSFKSFMNKKATRFVKRNNLDWATFNNVVHLFNYATGSFLNLSEGQKVDFFEASEAVKVKLSKMNKKESKKWLDKVNVTEKVFAFIWNSQIEEQPLEINFELPVLEVETSLSR